ncbi:hypothetical protein ACSLVQ_28620, partial [Klebsiella pneumoniae]|uniref:hypothetical protein n=1 Tax=Klebsiella pneumoniae TaxID=573 RepID=UPI003EDF6C5D
MSKNMAYSLANDIQVIYELHNQKIEASKYKKIVDNLHINFTISHAREKNKKDEFSSGTELLHSILKKYFNVPIKVQFIH